jgi:hypothetical protein
MIKRRPRQIELFRGVGVGVGTHHAPELERAPVPAPVEIKPVRDRVDLDADPALRAGRKHPLDVDVVARAPEQHAAGHVTEYGCEWVRDRPHYAFSLGTAIEPKSAVDAREDEVEGRFND